MNRNYIIQLLIESGSDRPARLESIIRSMGEQLTDAQLSAVADIYNIESSDLDEDDEESEG